MKGRIINISCECIKWRPSKPITLIVVFWLEGSEQESIAKLDPPFMAANLHRNFKIQFLALLSVYTRNYKIFPDCFNIFTLKWIFIEKWDLGNGMYKLSWSPDGKRNGSLTFFLAFLSGKGLLLWKNQAFVIFMIHYAVDLPEIHVQGSGMSFITESYLVGLLVSLHYPETKMPPNHSFSINSINEKFF